MYLKSLVLKGFKSFADRSVLTMQPGITAIVGPNGSGKSNIADAVLWVLGERNAKNLRGQIMEDVIFSGSSSRKSVGVAEVQLVLDNSDGFLPVDYSEVVIGRRMFRSGESEYLINGTIVRRLDVLDVLHDTGLGTGTHSIISQGHLDSILQSKPEDRRALIEEAAGVLKHKQKKERSQRKLEAMDLYLTRVNDIVSEVGRQLGPLERKAKRALRYKSLSAELADLGLQLAVDDLRVLKTRWGEIEELEKQLGSEVEARRALAREAEESFDMLASDIRAQSSSAMSISNKLHRATSAIDHMDSTVLLLEEKRRSARLRIDELEGIASESALKKAGLEGAIDELAKELAAVGEAVDALETQVQEAAASNESVAASKANLFARREELGDIVKGAKREMADAEDTLRSLQIDMTKNESRISLLEHRLEEVEAKQQGAAGAFEEAAKVSQDADETLAATQAEADAASAAYASAHEAAAAAKAARDAAFEADKGLHSEIMALEEIERAFRAQAGEAREWLVSESSFKGRLTSLIDILDVDEGYESCVELVLGDTLQALCAESTDEALDIEQVLASKSLDGRVSLFVQGAARGASAPSASSGFDALSDHVRASGAFADAVRILFADIAVCKDLREAFALVKKADSPLCFVTQSGSILYPDGHVVLGSASGAADMQGSLTRLRRLEQARAESKEAHTAFERAEEALAQAEDELDRATDAHYDAREAAARAQAQAEHAKRASEDAGKAAEQAESEVAAISADIAAAKQALVDDADLIAQAQARIDAARKLLAENEQALAGIEEQCEPLLLQIAQAEEVLNHLNQQLSAQRDRQTFVQAQYDLRKVEFAAAFDDEHAALRAIAERKVLIERIDAAIPLFHTLIAQATIASRTLENEAAAAEEQGASIGETSDAAREKLRVSREALDEVNERLSELRVEKGRLEVQVETAVQTIMAETDLPLEDALAIPEPENREELQENVARLKRSIANLGTINPDAAEEYEALKERYDYLNGQLQDLNDARAALKKIDRVIEERMKDDFINTFQQVNANFQEIFAFLFPGGNAELILEDPDDLENTGVEVIAQPKGKKVMKMTLMSGGEKSLIALALLFAVYRIRTTPFYILDEVEAALDDTNLRRLIDYLEELRSKTQLIMITHQRRTMEMADVLFGVSMQSDGVTKVVSQKLERALEYAE